MKSMESRIAALEKQVTGGGIDAELYNWRGEQVDAKIVKRPTKQSGGVAIMPDRSKRDIAAKITLLDIIHERRRRAESGEEHPETSEAEDAAARAASRANFQNMLFLREGGHRCFLESLANTYRERVSDNGERLR